MVRARAELSVPGIATLPVISVEFRTARVIFRWIADKFQSLLKKRDQDKPNPSFPEIDLKKESLTDLDTRNAKTTQPFQCPMLRHRW